MKILRVSQTSPSRKMLIQLPALVIEMAVVGGVVMAIAVRVVGDGSAGAGDDDCVERHDDGGGM